MLLRSAHPAPAQPRRGPPAQPRAAHHRGHPRPTRPRDQGVPRSQRGRRQNQEGRAALPQAPPRAPLLPPPRRATRRPTANRRARVDPRARAARDPRASPPGARGRADQHRAQPDGLHQLNRSDQQPISAVLRRAGVRGERPPPELALPQQPQSRPDTAPRGRQRRVLSPSAALKQRRATRHTPESHPPTDIPDQTQIVANSDRRLT